MLRWRARCCRRPPEHPNCERLLRHIEADPVAKKVMVDEGLADRPGANFAEIQKGAAGQCRISMQLC